MLPGYAQHIDPAEHAPLTRPHSSLPDKQERKRCEETQREAEEHAGRTVEAARRVERLAGEAAELQAALEQKQELITALQVGYSLCFCTLYGCWCHFNHRTVSPARPRCNPHSGHLQSAPPNRRRATPGAPS